MKMTNNAFVKCPMALLNNTDLNSNEFRILLSLISTEMNKSREAFYSYQKYIADSTGISLKTVNTSIKRLAETGYITISKNGNSVGSRNIYSINWKMIDGASETSKEKERKDCAEKREEEKRDLTPDDTKMEELAIDANISVQSEEKEANQPFIYTATICKANEMPRCDEKTLEIDDYFTYACGNIEWLVRMGDNYGETRYYKQGLEDGEYTEAEYRKWMYWKAEQIENAAVEVS